MTRLAFLLFGVVLLLGGLLTAPGCGREGSNDVADSTEPAAGKTGDGEDVAKYGGTEADGQPAKPPAKKYLLRYDLTPGERSTLVMKMESLGGTAAVPPMTMKMDVTVDSASAEGFSFSFEYTDMTINGEPLPSTMKGVLGMKGDARCTSRGETLSAEFRLPDDAPELLKTMLKGMEKQIREMSCPLPEHAVGVGDTWTLSQKVSAGMFSIDQTATYTLKECDGKHCVLDVKIHQLAERQELNLPGLPEGMEATLNHLTGEGAGTMEIELSSALPKRSSVEISSKFSMTIGGSAQDQSSRVRVTFSTE